MQRLNNPDFGPMVNTSHEDVNFAFHWGHKYLSRSFS